MDGTWFLEAQPRFVMLTLCQFNKQIWSLETCDSETSAARKFIILILHLSTNWLSVRTWQGITIVLECLGHWFIRVFDCSVGVLTFCIVVD